jgi:hypothetical protein
MERTVGKSYQESVMMHHQIQYAQGYEGDLAVELNCTGPTNITKGKGLAMMKIDDHVVQGMVHIGQLVSSGSRLIQTGYNSTKSRDLKNPIINVDANYIGTFYIKKDMTVEIEKPKPEEYEAGCHAALEDSQTWIRQTSSPYTKMPCSIAPVPRRTSARLHNELLERDTAADCRA